MKNAIHTDGTKIQKMANAHHHPSHIARTSDKGMTELANHQRKVRKEDGMSRLKRLLTVSSVCAAAVAVLISALAESAGRWLWDAAALTAAAIIGAITAVVNWVTGTGGTTAWAVGSGAAVLFLLLYGDMIVAKVKDAFNTKVNDTASGSAARPGRSSPFMRRNRARPAAEPSPQPAGPAAGTPHPPGALPNPAPPHSRQQTPGQRNVENSPTINRR